MTPDSVNQSESRWLIPPLSLRRSNDETILKEALSARETLCTSLNAVMDAVRNEQLQVQSALARWQNWQRPAVRLPSEILSNIFELACLSRPNALALARRNWQDVRNTRSAIHQTCSRWAHMALSTSSLWSTIELFFPDHYYRKGCPSPALVLKEVQRASGRPLSLNLRVRSDTVTVESLHPDLSPLLHHCEFLQMAATWSQGRDLFNAPLMRQVRSLVIDCGFQTPTRRHNILDVSDSYFLRDLWIRDRGHDRTLISSPTSCNITRLHLEGAVDPTSAINLINSCVRLEALGWSCSTCPVQFPKLKVLPHLQQLNLINIFPLSLFKDVAAPNLVRLRLSGHWKHDDEPHPLKTAPHFPKLRAIEIDIRSDYAEEDRMDTFFVSHPDIEDVVFTLVEANADSVALFGTHPSNLKRLWLKSTNSDLRREHISAVRSIWLPRLEQEQSSGPCSFKMYICPSYIGTDPTVKGAIARLRATSTSSTVLETGSPSDEYWRCPGPFGL